jgi:hypothetical protein
MILNNTVDITISKEKLVESHKFLSIIFDTTLPDKELKILIFDNPET